MMAVGRAIEPIDTGTVGVSRNIEILFNHSTLTQHVDRDRRNCDQNTGANQKSSKNRFTDRTTRPRYTKVRSHDRLMALTRDDCVGPACRSDLDLVP